MKIERKKGVDKIKISHNKKLFWIIIILLILLGILIYFIVKNSNQDNKKNNLDKECNIDEDCVPLQCCHADTCVNKDKKQKCIGVACTLDCSGPLDCGAGYCGCVNNKCQVIKEN